MNIFKVLASRTSFKEDLTSVLLGWLMHPDMDHGMGRLFLEHMVIAVAGDNSDMVQQLKDTPDDSIRCTLEEYVNTALIDIVYFFGDYIFAIENKIRDKSIRKNQFCGVEFLLKLGCDFWMQTHIAFGKSNGLAFQYHIHIQIIPPQEHKYINIAQTNVKNIILESIIFLITSF